MKPLIIDTRNTEAYMPIVTAIEGICKAPAGQIVHVLMHDDVSFHELKRYLIAHHIGFREIYDVDTVRIEFTQP
ncbi:MAG TPA: sulfurtransferase TusA family protein [Bacteroidaceae bacterium]|nr:sulfurtransferase TusA family protein [Bacteroidaceae bacterium]